jgi:hypothetical protein
LPICEETSNRELDDVNRKAVNVLQPRVGRLGTLGREWLQPNRNGCAVFDSLKKSQPLAVGYSFSFLIPG